VISVVVLGLQQWVCICNSQMSAKLSRRLENVSTPLGESVPILFPIFIASSHI